MKTTKTKTSMSRLDDYCLAHIFSYLPIMDRVRMERVCKRWSVASKMSWMSTKNLDLNGESWSSREKVCFIVDLPMIEKVLSLCGNYLTQVEFGKTHCNPKVTIFKDFQASRNLFKMIKKWCPNVKRFHVHGLKLTNSGINYLINNFKDIESVKLTGYKKINDMILLNFFQKTSKLQCLSLSEIPFTADHIFEVIGKNCLELSKLELRDLKITKSGLQSILSLPKLRNIYLKNMIIIAENIRDDLFVYKTQLEKITIHSCINITKRRLLSLLLYADNLKVIEIGHYNSLLLKVMEDIIQRESTTINGRTLNVVKNESQIKKDYVTIHVD